MPPSRDRRPVDGTRPGGGAARWLMASQPPSMSLEDYSWHISCQKGQPECKPELTDRPFTPMGIASGIERRLRSRRQRRYCIPHINRETVVLDPAMREMCAGVKL